MEEFVRFWDEFIKIQGEFISIGVEFVCLWELNGRVLMGGPLNQVKASLDFGNQATSRV